MFSATSQTPRVVQSNQNAWHALISIGAHFPLSNLLPHSDPVFPKLM